MAAFFLTFRGVSRGQRIARVLIDTDAANYFDDQFAIAYAATSIQEIRLEAVYAAPFTNSRVSDAARGMELSLDEIGALMQVLGMQGEVQVLPGAPRTMTRSGEAVPSQAAEDIIRRTAGSTPEDCFLVSIGPATNTASALLMDPGLARRITVVWLGGTPHDFPSASEFNLRQDVHAVRVLLDSGVRLMHVPAQGIAEKVSITIPELKDRLSRESEVASLLQSRVARHVPRHEAGPESQVSFAIWDMAAIAALMGPEYVEFRSVSSPLLGQDMRWSAGAGRHEVQVATRISPVAIFKDFFRKLHMQGA